MERKGKEIAFGPVRVDTDPARLLKRILYRQKVFLVAVAILGGAITIGAYVRAPRLYESSAEIAIRTELMHDDYVRKLLNRAFRKLHSDTEMMRVMNELNLYPSLRASLPYEVALGRIRRELNVDRQTGSISIRFTSKSPEEAQQVVNYSTVRILRTLGDLLESPHTQELEALDQAIDSVHDSLEHARSELFNFEAANPSIAANLPVYLQQSEPLDGLNQQISRAERSRKLCFLPKEKREFRDPDACRQVKALEEEKAELLRTLQPAHPTVRRIEASIAQQQGTCDVGRKMTGASEFPTESADTQECLSDVNQNLEKLIRERVALQKRAIRKPELQREWADLTLEKSLRESQLSELRSRRGRTMEQRLLAANQGQENFQLVDPPRMPELPVKPVRSIYMIIGMLITAGVGLGVALVREALRQTYTDEQELKEKTGLPVLASLPPVRSRVPDHRAKTQT